MSLSVQERDIKFVAIYKMLKKRGKISEKCNKIQII